MSEKRKEHRFRADLPVRVFYRTAELLSSTENISRLGTYAQFNREIPVGEELDVTLVVPAYTRDPALTGEVRCRGSVFRSTVLRQTPTDTSWGTGIFFTAFDGARDKEKLSAYIDHLTRQEEQEIKEGLRRRREKDQVRHLQQLDGKQDEFQKETITLLRQISARLAKLERFAQRKGKTK